MQLKCSIASLLLIYSTSFALELHIPSSGDNNTDSTTRSQRVQSLVTHGIRDKAAYPKQSNRVTVVISYLTCFFTQLITRENITPELFHAMMQFTFKPVSNHLWKWID